MISRLLLSFLLAMALLAPVVAAPAAAENEVEIKLREALRDSMLKLRDAQGQIATLQAGEVLTNRKVEDLTAAKAQLTKDLLSERNAAANTTSELNTKLDERATIITTLQTSLEKWKRSYKEVTSLAAKKEADRAKFQSKSIALDRQVADQKIRNIQMYQVGVEILNRYENFGLGDALLAREPFVGTTRVKFQNLIQQDQDQLTDSRIGEKKKDG